MFRHHVIMCSEDWIHNLWNPVQNENAELLVQKLLRISRGWQHSMKPNMGSFWVRGPGWPQKLHIKLAVWNTLWEMYYHSYFIYEEYKSKLWESNQPAPNVTVCERGPWSLRIVGPGSKTSLKVFLITVKEASFQI